MKRIVLEWGLIFSVVMILGLAALWVDTRFLTRESYPLELYDTRWGGDRVYLIVARGNLSLSDGISHGRPWKLTSPHPVDAARGDRYRHFAVWGFDYRSYYRAPWDDHDWSLQLSLLIPVALFSLLALWLYRSFRRLRRRAPVPS
jgi:hypothetical protein